MGALIATLLGRQGQFAAGLLALAAVMQWVILPMRERNQLIHARIETLRAANAKSQAENERLVREIRSLQDDPVYIEHVLRQDLRYVRPGEIPPRGDGVGSERERRPER